MSEFNLIQTPIKKLQVNPKFARRCQEMGFVTLEDILALSAEELLSTPGFSYHWLAELTDLLNKHQITHLLQPVPGKRFY